jgi:hypothetical protein
MDLSCINSVFKYEILHCKTTNQLYGLRAAYTRGIIALSQSTCQGINTGVLSNCAS